MEYSTFYFGQAYGTGQYGAGSYSCTTQQQQNGECSTAAGTTDTSGGSSGGLANTGIAVAMIVTLACLIVFVSLIVRIWRRKPVMQEADASSPEQTTDSPRE